MVHHKKLIYAAKRYIEDEIAAKFPGSIKGGILSFAAFAIGERGERLFEHYKNAQPLAAMGIISGEDVDEELLLAFLRSKMQSGRISLPVPVAGNMDFTTQDIEIFARMLRE